MYTYSSSYASFPYGVPDDGTPIIASPGAVEMGSARSPLLIHVLQYTASMNTVHVRVVSYILAVPTPLSAKYNARLSSHSHASIVPSRWMVGGISSASIDMTRHRDGCRPLLTCAHAFRCWDGILYSTPPSSTRCPRHAADRWDSRYKNSGHLESFWCSRRKTRKAVPATRWSHLRSRRA